MLGGPVLQGGGHQDERKARALEPCFQRMIPAPARDRHDHALDGSAPRGDQSLQGGGHGVGAGRVALAEDDHPDPGAGSGLTVKVELEGIERFVERGHSDSSRPFDREPIGQEREEQGPDGLLRWGPSDLRGVAARSDRLKREPTRDRVVEDRLEPARHGPRLSGGDRCLVDPDDRKYLNGGADQERLVGGLELVEGHPRVVERDSSLSRRLDQKLTAGAR